MQALIDFIIRNLLNLWPVARVTSWEQGLRIRGGQAREELPPGLHWRIPFLDEVRTWPSNECALDLETAAVTTTDGRPVAISANLSYRMTSIRAMHLALWGTESSLRRIALGHVASACASRGYDALLADRRALEEEMRQGLCGIFEPMGVTVVRLCLTDLVHARPHRHYMDGEVRP